MILVFNTYIADAFRDIKSNEISRRWQDKNVFLK